jgi:hypothetical protein
MNFIDWRNSISGEMDHIALIMSEKLSDEPEKLIDDVTICEAWYSRVGFMLAEANSILEEESVKCLPEEGTELSKKVALQGALAPIKKTRDQIKILLDAIGQRISLSQSILKYHTIFHDNAIRDKAYQG